MTRIITLLCVILVAPCSTGDAISDTSIVAGTHCPADRTCQYRQRVTLDSRRDEVRTGYMVFRPVAVAALNLWRYDIGIDRWVAEEVHGREIVIKSDGRQNLESMFGRHLKPALYFAILRANGQPECHSLYVGDDSCQDVDIGPDPSGRRATCLPFEGARFVPDPRHLWEGCAHGGFVSLDAPRSGRGIARILLEDGRLAGQGPWRDGGFDGVLVKRLREYDGQPWHLEMAFRAGKLHGPHRYFSPDGRLVNEVPYSENRRHGVGYGYGPGGQLLSKSIWRNDWLMMVQTFDEHGKLVSEQDYGPEGRQ